MDTLAGWLNEHYGLDLDGPRLCSLWSSRFGETRELENSAAALLARALARDAATVALLLDVATVRETYLFRHQEQLDFLRAEARSKLSSGGHTLRALSVGCATGEEAWSLAAALVSVMAECHPVGVVEVVGLDVNHQALEVARRGRYGTWSLRTPIPSWAEQSVCLSGAGARPDVHVSKDLTQVARFAHVNLAAPALPFELAQLGTFDFVLCRNVLMYLAPDVARRAVDALASVVAERGYLVLAPLDRELQPAGFERLRHEPSILRRPTRPSPEQPVPPPAATPPRPRPSVSRLPPTPAASGLTSHGAEEVIRLMDSGLRVEATAQCRGLLAQHPGNAQLWYLLAMLRLDAGDQSEAARALTSALDREPSFALAHFAMAMLMRRAGKLGEARARFLRLASLLHGIPADTRLSGPGDVTCGWLRTVVHSELR